jgi:hypothetical protein
MSEFCLPTVANAVAAGPDWLHERIERDGNRVRLITRGGYNSTRRYPWIVEGARKVRRNRFVIDGEAVVLGVDGISDFNALQAASTTARSSSARSTCLSKAARRSLTDCSRGDRMEFFSATSNISAKHFRTASPNHSHRTDTCIAAYRSPKALNHSSN